MAGMIFDIAFFPGDEGDIIVSCGEGAVICDAQLHRKRVLNHKQNTASGEENVVRNLLLTLVNYAHLFVFLDFALWRGRFSD